ncbi:MAG: molybdopterin-synthase adenylyltransferase MoeB [Bacillota bacterium]
MTLSPRQEARYSRNIVIPEIGAGGQERLLGSSVLVVGAGGLGSPALYYLAAAGVGTLGVIDADVVDVSNLQRQILHREADVGRPKVESAAEKLEGLNPDVRLKTFSEALAQDNALEILRGFQAVVDATDNYQARYVINDACVRLGVPMVHGSIFRTEGQASVFWPPDGPCYRCLFPKPPPPEATLSPQQAGVLGAAPGVIGAIQAMETIKILLGVGRTLRGRLLLFNGLTLEFIEVSVEGHPGCPVCQGGRSTKSQ